ncbi:MAG: hypothetical protein EBT28_03390 [Betaproteobacteria bacterium]|nr:hypothetical protein [Betaproteobacteria bacterium]
MTSAPSNSKLKPVHNKAFTGAEGARLTNKSLTACVVSQCRSTAVFALQNHLQGSRTGLQLSPQGRG